MDTAGAPEVKAASTEPQEVITIRNIWLRTGGTSLEGAFLKAMLTFPALRLTIAESIRQTLHTEKKVKFADQLNWKFKSAAALNQPAELSVTELLKHHRSLLEDGDLFFNVCDLKGQPGAIDHHDGNPDNTLCSLDELRGKADFLEIAPELNDLLVAIGDNDIYGTAITKDGHNIRTLMSDLLCMDGMDDKSHLHLVSSAFIGAFAMMKQIPDCTSDEALSIKGAIRGLKLAGKEGDANTLQMLWKFAQASAKKDWLQACKDVDRAIELGKVKEVVHSALSPKLRRSVRTILVRSNTIKAGAATRRKKLGKEFDLAVIVRPDNTVQIVCNDAAETRKQRFGDTAKPTLIAKWRIDLGQIAMELRLSEAGLRNQSLVRGADWACSNYTYDTAGRAVTWFLAQWRSLLAHSTLGTPDVKGSKINENKIFAVAAENLPYCGLRRATADNDYTFEEWGAKHYRPNRQTPRKKGKAQGSRNREGTPKNPGPNNGNCNSQGSNDKDGEALAQHMQLEDPQKK